MGANQGHVSALVPISRRLAELGHHVWLAVCDLSAVSLDVGPNVQVIQAPVWAGSTRLAVGSSAPPRSTQDLMVLAGAADHSILRHMIRAWEALLQLTGADVVIAESAPALLMAARTRVRTLAIGTAASIPSLKTDLNQGLHSEHGWSDGRKLLRTICAVLRERGLPSLASTASIFEADRRLVGSFPMLDPYRTARHTDVYAAPAMSHDARWPNVRGSGGEEVFVYFHNTVSPRNGLWQALSATRLPIRIHVRAPSSALLRMIQERQFAFESMPLTIDRIASRSRIVMSHGGHGLASAALAAGIPHFVLGYDGEKMWNGLVIQSSGLGVCHAMGNVTAAAVARDLYALYLDEMVASQALLMADRLRSEARPSYLELIEGDADVLR